MTSNPFFSKPDNPRCTCCKLTLSAHTPAQLVECALKELRGEKN